jgi:benzodiazapine receptor
MNLTTFRKNGLPVRTPVWFSEVGGQLHVYTGHNTGKAKRIRNDGGVLVGPCNARGKPLGSETAGVARLLPPEESAVAEESLNRKYGLQRRTVRLFLRLLGRGYEEVYLEISPAPQGDPNWEKMRAAQRAAPNGEGGTGARSRGSAARLFRTVFRPERYRWWHALAFGLVVNLVGARTEVEDREYYEDLRQAPFAPPALVFGPAWAINNASVLWGNLRLLNLPEGAPNRRPLLWLQGASWALFSTFSYVYFRKRSPILAFVWTATFYVLTVISAILSWRVDRKISLSFVTLLLWLSLATLVAAYQMTHNPDPLFRTSAQR